MSGIDSLQRLIFSSAGVRAVHVRVDRVYREVLARGEYPGPVARLLGEGLVVAALLSSGIKFSGRISLQLRSSGPLKMLLADCTEQGGMRALATLAEGGEAAIDELAEPDLLALAPAGVLTLNLEPLTRGRSWQGVVPLEGPDLAGGIEQYFVRSEQLPTRLHLASDGQQAAGLLLQRLPGESEDDDGWNRLCHLLDTVRTEELLTLDGEALTHRLFHEEDRTRFPSRDLQFFCPCSRDRVSSVLRSLGQEELEDLLAEQGEILTTCEFCNEEYAFDAMDVAQLLATDETPAGPPDRRVH